MTYYNYHAKIECLIKNGHCKKYKIFDDYHKISPALVLYFDNHFPMPIREYKFDYYFDLFDKFKISCDNETMNNNIIVLNGTKLKTNNYLVDCDGGKVLIDASAKLEDIENALGKDKLLAVFITHGHWDHYFTLTEILKRFNVKCYAHSEAIKKMRIDERGNWLKKIELPDDNFVKIDKLDSLIIGKQKFDILYTPGHTNCSVCYLLNNHLFSGDTLFYECYGRCDLPTGNENEMMSSLKTLFKLSDDIIVYPGHGENTSIRHEKKLYKL